MSLSSFRLFFLTVSVIFCGIMNLISNLSITDIFATIAFLAAVDAWAQLIVVKAYLSGSLTTTKSGEADESGKN